MKTFIHSYDTDPRDLKLVPNIEGCMCLRVEDGTHDIQIFLNACEVEKIHIEAGEWLRQLAQQLAEKNKATV